MPDPALKDKSRNPNGSVPQKRSHCSSVMANSSLSARAEMTGSSKGSKPEPESPTFPDPQTSNDFETSLPRSLQLSSHDSDNSEVFLTSDRVRFEFFLTSLLKEYLTLFDPRLRLAEQEVSEPEFISVLNLLFFQSFFILFLSFTHYHLFPHSIQTRKHIQISVQLSLPSHIKSNPWNSNSELAFPIY
jgi:hypothetical protein